MTCGGHTASTVTLNDRALRGAGAPNSTMHSTGTPSSTETQRLFGSWFWRSHFCFSAGRNPPGPQPPSRGTFAELCSKEKAF